MDKISIFYPIKVNVLNKIKVASMMINATFVIFQDATGVTRLEFMTIWMRQVTSPLVVLWSCSLVVFKNDSNIHLTPSSFPMLLYYAIPCLGFR